MKIVFLTGHAPSVYMFRLDCMKRLQADGFQVSVFAPETPEEWAASFEEHEISYTQIKMEKNSTNPISDFKAYLQIRKELKKLQPEVVFCDHAKMIIYGLLAAKHCHIRHRFVMMGGVGSVLRDAPESLFRKIIQRILAFEYRASVPCATKVFFQNRDDVALFERYRFICKNQVVMVPGSGINLDRFPAEPLPKNRDFLFVGRLIRDKGLVEAMDSARRVRKEFPDMKLHIVGYFDPNQTMMQQSDLQPYIEDGTVVFHGKQSDVFPYVRDSFAFVLPSYHEGTPRSVLEAMSVGRPVITTDAPGCRETVVDGYNGYLVPVKTTEPLAEAMKKLCANRELAIKMGKNGRKRAEEVFDVNIVCDIISKTILDAMEC